MEVLGKLRDDNYSLLGVGSVLQSRKKKKAQHLLHRSEVNFKNVIWQCRNELIDDAT